VLPIFEQVKGAVFNTAIVIDRGEIRGGYRKIHLFDAFGYRESDLFRAGTEPILFRVRDLVFGVVICYDIRFPELVKSEVMSGARVVVVPAAWFRGPLKEEQWQMLLMARAHENTSYVIGVGNANDAFVGRSMVVDPLGVKVLDLGSGDRVGYCEIDDRRVTEAREKLPVIQQSKPPDIRCRQL
jgi:predicted amidohydrolase